MNIENWHEFDPQYVEMRLQGAREGVSHSLRSDRPWNSDRIHMLQDDLVEVCVWSLVSSGGVSEEVWWALDGAVAAARLQFARASAPKGSRRLSEMIVGREVSTSASGPNRYTADADWLAALWLGLVSRDVGLLDVLRDFRLEWMAESVSEGVSFDPFHLEWARAWQMLLRGERGDTVGRQVLEVMRLTDPDLAPVAGAEFALQRVWPSVRLLWDVVSADRDGFGGDVRSALEAHTQYFTRPVDNRVRNVEGFVPWRLLGTVCAAVDSNFEVGVHSQYLPDGFLYGRQHGALKR